jgi:exopolysaccharide biosynthesis polyprenyl glycosylphosphotransferase
MIRLRHKMLIRLFRLLDQLLLVAVAAAIIYYIPVEDQGGPRVPIAKFSRLTDALGFLVLVVGWIGIFDYFIKYSADRFVGFATQLKDLLKAMAVATFWFLIISAIFSIRGVNLVSIAGFWGVSTSLAVIARLLLRVVLMTSRRSGFNYRYLLIIGANARSAELASKIDRSPELGYKLVGFVSEDREPDPDWEKTGAKAGVIGCIQDLRSILENERVDEVLVCLSVEASFGMVASIIKEARDLGVVLRIVPNLAEGDILKKFHVEEFEDEVVVTFFREQMLFQLLIKRLLDITASAIGLLVLSPLFVLVALLVKMTSPGPVFFVQYRVGMNQRRFRLFKFRSMVKDADEKKKELEHFNEVDGPAFKMGDDPRITKIGKFLRKTSIDELPQLFNVIKGEMSLVGPRPPLPGEVSKYEWLFRRRLSVKPGITCVWQISGRSNTSFEEWMSMDKEYVENWSLLLDFKILLLTIPAVLFGRGAC